MQTSMTPRPHRGLILRALPFKLREPIYKLLVTSERRPFNRIASTIDEEANNGRSPNLPRWLPSICPVNKATRIDVALPLLRRMTSSCHNTCLRILLDSIPNNRGHDAIRSLQFGMFKRSWPLPSCYNADADLRRGCAGIAQVSFVVRHLDLLLWEPEYWHAGKARTDALLDLSHLWKVIIECEAEPSRSYSKKRRPCEMMLGVKERALETGQRCGSHCGEHGSSHRVLVLFLL